MPSGYTRTAKEVFRAIDRKGNGFLTKEELVEWYRDLFGDKVEEEVERIIKEIDTDNNGSIEYTEFIKASIDTENLTTK